MSFTSRVTFSGTLPAGSWQRTPEVERNIYPLRDSIQNQNERSSARVWGQLQHLRFWEFQSTCFSKEQWPTTSVLDSGHNRVLAEAN